MIIWIKKTKILYQHVEIFPEVLGHESEKGEERPSETVEAGITIVGIPSGFHAGISLRTSPENNIQISENRS